MSSRSGAARRPSIEQAAAAFHEAAFGEIAWTTALESLAALTGSRSAQLIGIGGDRAVPFNLITDLDPQVLIDWGELGGGDPSRNARVRAGLAAAELDVMTEADFASEEDLRSDVYELYRRSEIGHTGQAALIHNDEMVIGLSVLRNERQGPLEGEDRKAFALLAPQIRAAVRTRIRLEGESAKLLAGAMDAVRLAALVLDHGGRVRAASPRAAQLLSSGEHLAMSAGRLRAACRSDQGRLSELLRHPRPQSGQGTARPTYAKLRSVSGGPALLVEALPLPQARCAPSFSLGVLLIAREPAPRHERAAELARTMYSLTSAEAAVAADLVAGLPIEEIARRRHSQVSTVRTHIRRLLAKAGVRRQLELVSELNARL